MPELKLTVARWRQRTDNGTVLHRHGDLVEVEEAVAQWLLKSGAAAHPTTDDNQSDEDTADQGIDSDPDSDDAPADNQDTEGDSERPLNAATKAIWEDYAKSKGIDTKGMDKAEIIAAVG